MLTHSKMKTKKIIAAAMLVVLLSVHDLVTLLSDIVENSQVNSGDLYDIIVDVFVSTGMAMIILYELPKLKKVNIEYGDSEATDEIENS